MAKSQPKLPIQNSSCKNLINQNKILNKFLAEKDMPAWYRGISSFQIEAAESLFNSLRDDTQQDTSHRVQRDIMLMGVSPLISSDKVKLVMQLSRGNDLAFLWFLMDLFYKCNDQPPKVYNVNEQIIMSCIAHLDMITTLRELDKILPHQTTPELVAKKVTPKREKQKYKLPYFEPLPEPVPQMRKKCVRHSHGPIKLRGYESYKDDKFMVCNEQNRWFSTYELSQSKRVVKGILSEEIRKVVYGECSVLLNQTSLCAHHRIEAERRDFGSNVQMVQAKEVCMEHFDIELRKKEATKVKFRKRVEHMIAVQRGRGQPRRVPSNSNEKDNIDENYVKKYDFGHRVNSLFGKERPYFSAPQPHRPLKFNYDRIYGNSGGKQSLREVDKEGLKEAAKIDQNSGNSRKKHDLTTNKEGKKALTKRMVSTLDKNSEEEKKEEASKGPNTLTQKYNLPDYDPRDKALMEAMLIDALSLMKKDPKFVLASMPDCHKVPVLREWICARYGFIYTRKEKMESYIQSKRVFYELKKLILPVELPRLDQLGTKRYVSYKCRDTILKNSMQLMEDYYHKCKLSLMESIRVFWNATEPYQCSGGSMRKTFYAYMPSKFMDILLFRPYSSWINLRDTLQVITKKRRHVK